MKLLALDTSTQACSVAVNLNGEIQENFAVIPRQHARQLMPMVDDLLSSADVSLKDLDAIVVGVGPGSFTGLRIAASVAQGLAFAADIPTLPVSSLAALALGVYRTEKISHVFTVMDAHMQELFWAGYQVKGEQVQVVMDEQLTDYDSIQVPEDWHQSSQPWLAVGDGLQHVDWPSLGLQPTRMIPEVYPHAYDLAVLGASAYQANKSIPAEELSPVYLRGRNAWKTIEDRMQAK